MQVLLVLTLIYAAVLVLALAISLIAIWWQLRGVDRALDAARGSLEGVRDATQALDERLTPIGEPLLEALTEFQTAAQELSEADRRVREHFHGAPAGTR